MYPYIAPENFENSKITIITNEQLSIKISDLLEQKEISKYINTKEELISIIQKYCEFFQLSDDKEKIQYILPEGMTVFSILNIPPNLNKEEVKHHLELINLQYNRLYKKGFYWYLCTIDKETVICVQNSLRELIFDEVRIKYIHNNKNQILKNMKDKMDKNSYQKDAKYLGINYNNGYKYNYNYNKGKMSDSDSGSFSWRKGSGGTKSSFDYNEKPNKKGKYYKYKRNRFNSDNDGKKYKNYYKNYGSNNSNISNNSNQEAEIDISKLKYSLNIKNKYSFGDIKSFYEKEVKNNKNISRPKFLNETLTDILGNNPKEIVSLNELIESNEKNKKSENQKKNEKEKNNGNNINNNNINNNINNINTNIKIPKMNPLSGMSKNFNKFDIVPGNAMPGLMMPFETTTWIPESNKEQ